MEFESLYNEYKDVISTIVQSLALALVVLLVGLFVIRKLKAAFRRNMEKRELNPSLKPFLTSLFDGALKLVLIISILGILGINTASFTVVLGSMGLAIGLALQGSLANFAGGVLILILKPFKVGDFIAANGEMGTVHEIQIFYTHLTTPQNQEIIMPNGSLSNAAITNYSYHNTRRMDLTFGISYAADIDKAKELLKEIYEQDERFLRDPALDIFVEQLADSSVNIRFRAWAKNSDFWGVSNNLPEKVKKSFDANGINIPFPQMDLHLVEDTTK